MRVIKFLTVRNLNLPRKGKCRRQNVECRRRLSTGPLRRVTTVALRRSVEREGVIKFFTVRNLIWGDPGEGKTGEKMD